jgi:hypothetical protein
MKREDGGGDFERWLDAELKRTLGSVKGPSPRAVQADYHAPSRRGRQLMNRIAVRTANGLAALALAVGGGAVVATTTTGSANPAIWGQQVESIVSDQVLERDTGPSSSADRSASVGKHVREERRTSNSPRSAPGHRDGTNEDAGSRHDDGRHDDGRHDDKCDDRGDRHKPSPSPRH